MEHFDVVVAGAGFGGLGAALRLSELGARVLLLERLTYPGGCACTFTRAGCAFDAGATLSSGLAEDQLFGRWIQRHSLELDARFVDEIIELRAPDFRLASYRDRARFEGRLASLSGDRAPAVRRWLRAQRRAADALWPLLEDGRALPPYRPADLPALLARAPSFAKVARWVGRPLEAMLRAYGVDEVAPLRAWIDATCQITLQCGAREVEAPLALATLDYAWRGAAHVEGGIGQLARALAAGVEKTGGVVRYADEVRGLARDGAGWIVRARRGEVRADHVVLNVLPQVAERLAGIELPRLTREVERSWGALMIYAAVRPPEGARREAHHLQLIDDPRAPLDHGNHVFVSLSGADEGRAPDGLRAATISTHVEITEDPARYDEVRARMASTLRKRAPEWWTEVPVELPASPRTFARFTGRTRGYVGGPPRRAGLMSYLAAPDNEIARGLYLVGDSMPPGQSTYATALGGKRVAEGIAGSLHRVQVA